MHILLRATRDDVLGAERIPEGVVVGAYLELVPAFYLCVKDFPVDTPDVQHAALFYRLELVVVLPVGDDGPHAFFCDALALGVAATCTRRHCVSLRRQTVR